VYTTQVRWNSLLVKTVHNYPNRKRFDRLITKSKLLRFIDHPAHVSCVNVDCRK